MESNIDPSPAPAGLLRELPFTLTDEMKRVYLRRCYTYAKKHSPDPSTQNGACLVAPNGGIVSFGANHFPRGVENTDERWERPTKYTFVAHAETNAIYGACRMGVRTEGLIMVCPWFACAECGKAIIQAGISKVIGHQKIYDATPEHWRASIAAAFEMFAEAGVETELYQGDLGGDTIRLNGEIFQP